MSDETKKPRKAKFLPMAVNNEGHMKGVLLEKDGFSLGGFRPIKEGEPLMGGPYAELKRKEDEVAFDATFHDDLGLDEIIPTDDSEESTDRKTWGSTDEYRSGWDRIWGNKTEVGEA